MASPSQKLQVEVGSTGAGLQISEWTPSDQRVICTDIKIDFFLKLIKNSGVGTILSVFTLQTLKMAPTPEFFTNFNFVFDFEVSIHNSLIWGGPLQNSKIWIFFNPVLPTSNSSSWGGGGVSVISVMLTLGEIKWNDHPPTAHPEPGLSIYTD